MSGNKAVFLTFLLSVLLLQACDKNTVYKEYIDIPDKIWDRSFQPEFEFDIEDSEQAYKVDVLVRNASMYPYSNVWIFIHTTSPTGKTDIDTLECVLADPSGKWLGDGMGDIWDNEIPWLVNYKFEHTGTYTIKLEQAMRMEKLPGIMDVGIAVEKPEQE
ncbi:MAG: gliding motility lipoprotein GldH [Bacteroidota bacterium]